MAINRRTFLEGALASAVSLRPGRASGSTPAAPVLQPVPYGNVQLLEGPLQRQFDENHQFFLNLSEDRLLKIYRQRTGLPAPGEDMGGWYDDFCPGASFGQYLSALARFAAATHSAPTRAKVERLVSGYARTLDPGGKFFVDLRYPAYTYDKLVCGLIDAYSLAGNQNAPAVLRATTDAALPHMPERALTSEEQQTRPHKDETYTWDETYTLAENLFLASERLGDRRYFELGRRYLLDRTFFDPLSNGENVLPGLHAYSHMNALSSGMQGYLKLGDGKYLRAVNNAVEMIWRDQSFATGGWGPNEAFVKPGSGGLGDSLATTHRSFETPCGAYAHIKLMRYLLALTGEARYGDSMERVLYNTVLGAKPILDDGSSFYYSDYGHNASKTYRRVVAGSSYRWDRDGRWPCCSGTLPQVTADYVADIYFQGAGGPSVNLYVPSRLDWTAGSMRCSLTQQTSYPNGNLVTLQLASSGPAAFTISLRIPAWAAAGSSVSVNGTRLTAELLPGTFLPLQRTWKSGDRIELDLRQPVSAVPVDSQHPDQIAIIRGALVLFGIAETQPLLSSAEAARLPQLARAAGNDWTLPTLASALTLRPFADIRHETYQTYLKISS